MSEHAAEARRTQRLGAYAVVVRADEHGTDHLLLTRISAVGYPPGWWALPGGGVDHGEAPGDAVRRELWEETGLRAADARLVDVHDLHVVEEGRGGRYEDYHGVHLLYVVRLEETGEPLPVPTVQETDGTTDLATWLPLSDLPPDAPGPGPLLAAVQHVLATIDPYR